MLKVALFILFIGGFQFNGADKFNIDKQGGFNTFVDMGSTWQVPASIKAEVIFVQDEASLIELIKENKDKELLIYDLKQDCTMSFKLIPVTRKWKEQIEKEEVIGYGVELK